MPNLEAFQNFTLHRRTFLSAALSLIVVPKTKAPFSVPLDAPPPRFWFGDRVVDHFWGEDPQDMTREIEFIERGTVVGLGWGKDYWYGNPAYQSWWCFVNWDSDPDGCLTQLHFAEESLKSEAEFTREALRKRA